MAKSKLAISLLIISNCIAFLIIASLGYALWKSTQSDGMIGVNVTTGECKIDIINTEGASIIGDVLDFVSNTDKEEVLFEPGAIYYTEGFRVKNVGSIPVKFRVYISEDREEAEGDFEDSFDVYIAKSVGDGVDTESFTSFNGEIAVGQTSETYYLVVQMKEDAGNEFQNKTYSGVGITVYAVQIGAND